MKSISRERGRDLRDGSSRRSHQGSGPHSVPQTPPV